VQYPYVTKEQFSGDVKHFVSADNIFLTFMSGLGFPFLITYVLALIVLFKKLIGMAFRPPPGFFFPPLALLLPLAMALVHFQLYDGLLFAQNSWFFHLLLGLIPWQAKNLEASEPISAGPGLSCAAFEPNLSSDSQLPGMDAEK
jgi:hypothetical protein